MNKKTSNKGVAIQAIEMRNIEDVKPYSDNPRYNTDKAIDNVAMSIKTFGFNIPIVVDADGCIIAGHTRRLAAIKLKLKQVPVVVAKHLDDAEIKAFRIADNRVSEDSEWDNDYLASELSKLQGLGFDLSLTGFETYEVEDLIDLTGSDCLDGLDLATTEDVSPESGEQAEEEPNELPTVTASKRVSVSVGSYKFLVAREDYQEWEQSMLDKHGSKADVIRACTLALGFDSSEFNEKA